MKSFVIVTIGFYKYLCGSIHHFFRILMLLNTIWESAVQALGQLWANKLRSVLSLLGITIGVWCVIAVQAAINSLESNIRGGFEYLCVTITRRLVCRSRW